MIILWRIKYKVKSQQRHMKSFKELWHVYKILKKVYTPSQIDKQVLAELKEAVTKWGIHFNWNIKSKLFVPYSVIVYGWISRIFFLLENINELY